MQVLLLVLSLLATCRGVLDRTGTALLSARPAAAPRLAGDGDVCRTFPPHESERPCAHGLHCCSIYGVAGAPLVCKPVCGPGRP